MSVFEIVLLLVCIIMLLSMWYLFKSQTPLIEWLKSTVTNMQQSDKNVTDTLQQSYQALNQRLDHATAVINELKLETGRFSEIGHSMKQFQDFLNSPKLRGNLGERILADLMAQVLPKDSYQIQYRFRSGETVDAAIKTQTGLIPIDSKFPMDNYAKLINATTGIDRDTATKQFATDVKKHIKAIATKYIKIDEGTVDFAVMYVPAEAVYYEISANQPELTSLSADLRVLIVSPATFYAFLRTVYVSFEGQRIAKEAQVILTNLRAIKHDSDDFSQKLDLLSRHLTNAYNNMNSVSTSFRDLQNKIETTQSLPPLPS